jgi:probable HAF family extracellular repeat protein
MKKSLVNAGLLCLLSAFCLSANAETATFQIITDPVTGTWSNFAISGDGTVMAANYGGEIYRWTAAGGFQDLGPGDPLNSSIGISRDGSTIISGHVGSDGFTSPALWNANGVVDLGHPSNGCTTLDNSWGSGYGVNGNGTVAVGLAWTCTAAEGFAWTAKLGNVSLGHPAGNHSSRASAISANAKTIVGFWEDPTGPRRPVRWANGKHDLFLGPTTIGEASAVTSDGTQIAGQSPDASGNGVAFLYSDKSGLLSLGTITHSPSDQSFANGISDNGRIVGWSGDPFGAGTQAFVWTSSLGMKKLANVLNQFGANIPAGTTLTSAGSISADGSTVAGQYVDSQLHFGNWIAHITK